MTVATIRAALESRLNGMASPLPTAWDAMHYTPSVGTPWQRVRLLMNQPVDHAVTADLVQYRGILEVMLFYPTGNGTSAIAAKAQAIADRFAPVQTLTSGSTRVEITQTARIGSGLAMDDGWYAMGVSIPWLSFTG